MRATNNIQTGQAPVNGTVIQYETAGAGQPLVFVHAGIADRRMWNGQMGPFAEHFQVVRYDMRGFGQTPVVAGSYAHYEDLHGLLAHLGIEQAIVVGCSKGGAVALDFALAYPKKVKALVLVAAAIHGLRIEAEPLPQEAALDAAEEAGDLALVSEIEVQIWIDGGRAPAEVDPAVRDLVREMNLIALQNDVLGLGEEMRLEPAAAHRLSEITVPTLLLIGDRDIPASIQRYEYLIRHIPHAQTATLSDTAHLPNLEKPAEFNRLVLDFLQ
jgi:pimeloyl-ACP methyl ester carboxylesterase